MATQLPPRLCLLHYVYSGHDEPATWRAVVSTGSKPDEDKHGLDGRGDAVWADLDDKGDGRDGEEPADAHGSSRSNFRDAVETAAPSFLVDGADFGETRRNARRSRIEHGPQEQVKTPPPAFPALLGICADKESFLTFDREWGERRRDDGYMKLTEYLDF